MLSGVMEEAMLISKVTYTFMEKTEKTYIFSILTVIFNPNVHKQIDKNKIIWCA